jgi:hypothetical protein
MQKCKKRPHMRLPAIIIGIGVLISSCSTLVVWKPEKPIPPQVKPLPIQPIQPAQPSQPALTKLAPPVTSVAAPNLSLYRTQRIDPRVRSVQESVHMAAFKNPIDGLRNLTKALIGSEQDPFIKIKLIHDWICLNIGYDAAMLKSGVAINQTVEAVLASKTAVCSGYSRVFQSMADYAGIPSISVSGYIKNQAGQRGFSQSNSHAWNLVQIHGSWYIVDVTFDAGYVKDWVFVRKYSTDALFISPDASLYTRFPKNDEQQLIKLPISGPQFLDLPDVEGAFFSYGFDMPQPRLLWNNATQGSFSLVLSTAMPGIVLDAALFSAAGTEIVQATMLQRVSETTSRLLFTIPSTGSHTVEVYAKRMEERRFDYLIDKSTYDSKILPELKKLVRETTITNADLSFFITMFESLPNTKYYRYKEDPFDPAKTDRVASLLKLAGHSTGSLQKILSFALNNEKPASLQRFPYFYAQYQNARLDSCIEPLDGILSEGKKITFTYFAPESPKAALFAGDKIYHMVKSKDGTFSAQIDIPSIDRIRLGLSQNGSDYSMAVAWQVGRGN